MVSERLYGEGLRLLAGQHGPQHRAFLRGRARALAQLRDLAPARGDADGRGGRVARPPAPRARPTSRRPCSCWPTWSRRTPTGPTSEVALDRGRRPVRRARRRDGPGRDAAPAGLRRAAAVRLRRRRRRCSRTPASASRASATDGAWPGRSRTSPGARSTWAGPRRPRRSSGPRRPPSRSSATRPAAAGPSGLLAWTRYQQGDRVEAEAMAESIIGDVRQRGDRWALGMMLVLIGGVRLWTGRPAGGGREPRGGAGHRSRRSTTTSACSRPTPPSAGPSWPAGRIDEGFAVDARLRAGRPASSPTGSSARTCSRSWPRPTPPCRWATPSAPSGCCAGRRASPWTWPIRCSWATPSGSWPPACTGCRSATWTAALSVARSPWRRRLAPAMDPNVQSALALVRAAARRGRGRAGRRRRRRRRRALELPRPHRRRHRPRPRPRPPGRPRRRRGRLRPGAGRGRRHRGLRGLGATRLADAIAASARGDADAAVRTEEADAPPRRARSAWTRAGGGRTASPSGSAASAA